MTFADKFSKSEELVPSPDDNSETNRADSINHDDGLYILGGYLAKTQPPKVDNEPQRIGSYWSIFKYNWSRSKNPWHHM